MASIASTEIAHEILPLIRVYKDGRIQRLTGDDVVPASVDPTTGVHSKDVNISPETGISARLYLPKNPDPTHKLPLLVYFHGGGFVIESAFSPLYHNHLTSLTAEANVIVLSVNYRLAPEHPLPTAYEDSWAALKWVGSHFSGDGQEEWVNEYVDFERIFLGGDSAGANIAHNMGIRIGSEKLDGVKLVGLVLNHPWFWGEESIGKEALDVNGKEFVEKLWRFVNTSGTGFDDPVLNPAVDPKLSTLGCTKVLVCVGEKDILRDRGWYYYEVLGKSGWKGEVEIMEVKKEDHVFYLFNPNSENAVAMLKRMATFLTHHSE